MISVDVLILYIMIVDWFNDGRQSIVIVIIGEVNRYTIYVFSQHSDYDCYKQLYNN